MSYYTPVALFNIVKTYSEIERLKCRFETDLVQLLDMFLLIEKKQPIDHWMLTFPIFYEKLLERHSFRINYLDRTEYWSVHFKNLFDKFDINEFYKCNKLKKLDSTFILFNLRKFFLDLFWFFNYKLETFRIDKLLEFLTHLKDFTLGLDIEPIDDIIHILNNKIVKS